MLFIINFQCFFYLINYTKIICCVICIKSLHHCMQKVETEPWNDNSFVAATVVRFGSLIYQ
jgi:hypothetical protein